VREANLTRQLAEYVQNSLGGRGEGGVGNIKLSRKEIEKKA